MTKRTIGGAVIGYGGMGNFHSEKMQTVDGIELIGVYDIDPKQNELAKSRGIHAYASREELLADPRIDLVTVATPNDVHKEIVIAALAAGKNVICEKPVAMNSAELDEMIAAANKYGKLFTVHQNRRWDEDYLTVKKIFDEKQLGSIYRIESRVHGSRGIPSGWREEKEHGGGMVLDWGVHLIDQVLNVIGWDVKSVRCDFEHITNDEVDDGFGLRLVFESGARAYIEVGTYNFIAMPRFYMRGKSGTAYLSENTKVVKCKHWHESEVIPVQTAAGLTKTMAPRDSVTVDTYKVPRPHSDVHDFYRNYVDAIDGKCEQLVTHDQMRTVLRVIMRGFESAEAGGTEVAF